MKIGKYISVYPWLFVGWSVLPALISSLLLGVLLVMERKHGLTYGVIPAGVIYFTLPVYILIVGIGLACGGSLLLEKNKWLIKRQMTATYLALFGLVWNGIFGFLSFSIFAIGLGDGLPSDSNEQLMKNFVLFLSYGLSHTLLISLCLCLKMMVIIVVVFEITMLVCTKCTGTGHENYISK